MSDHRPQAPTRGDAMAWIDCSAGIAGDMLLGALLDAGADLERVRAAVAAVDPVLRIETEPTSRHAIAAVKATVIDASTGVAADHTEPPPSPHDHEHHHHAHHDHEHHHHGHHDHEHHHHGHHDHGHHAHEHTRTWAQVRELLDGADLDPRVRTIAHGVFGRLARAEGGVHGVEPDAVTFHEVGALDAIGDVVGCAQAWVDLGLTAATASVVTLGSGEQAIGQHGRIPIPGPAVVRLAAEAQMITTGGPVTMEMTTPTGAALLAELVDGYGTDGYGPAPTMIIDRVGCGAGTRDPHRLANLCRVVVGHRVADGVGVETAVVLETNVDDLDPRLWPEVIAELLRAGADDAWLTPMLMKKGRPAHTLSVLCPPQHRDRLVAVVLDHTTTLGIRERVVTKHVADRRIVEIDVLGHPVRLKVAERDGRLIGAQPEFDDLLAVATRTGRPLKAVQAVAAQAAAAAWPGHEGSTT